VWRCRATYHWKALDKGYNFALDLLIKGLHAKLWAPKVVEVLIVGISGLPFGSPKTKWHLSVGPMARHIVYYKGKVVASPKSKPWWVLWVHVCPWLVRAPKCSNYTLINLLFGLCKSVWVSEMFVNLLSPIPELQHGLLPLKCCEPRSVPNFLSFCSLHVWTHSWVHQRAWRCVNQDLKAMYNGHLHIWISLCFYNKCFWNLPYPYIIKHMVGLYELLYELHKWCKVSMWIVLRPNLMHINM
jgi:hypothetical protein